MSDSPSEKPAAAPAQKMAPGAMRRAPGASSSSALPARGRARRGGTRRGGAAGAGVGAGFDAWRPRLLLAAGTLLLGLLVTFAVVALSRPRAPLPAAPTAWRNLRRESLSAPPAAAPVRPEVESHIFQVSEVSGRVEAHRGRKWALVSRGDVLTQDDVVRTFNGRAVLTFGAATEVELRDRVEIRLDNISRAGASLDLRRGKVVARIGRTASNIVITAAKTRTENDRALPARFVVLADDRGQVTVAATEGAARFESAGQAVVVPAGRVTQASPGQPPDDPETISEEIFLSVTWPSREDRDDGTLPIAGRVDRRSSVRVNGVPADSNRGGSFSATVAAHDGDNTVEVEVEDISGRVRVEKRAVRKIPTRPPDLEPVKTELWK